MIQAIITRMANNSFALKGWAVTLVAGLFALSSKDANQFYYLVTYIPIVVFWFLDAYYLDQERWFRKLYEKVIQIDEANIDFSMVPPYPKCDDVTNPKERKKKIAAEKREAYFKVFISTTILGFYLPLAIMTAGIIIITAII